MCPEQIYVPPLRAAGGGPSSLQPKITGTVYVSFDINACKATWVNVMSSKELEREISKLQGYRNMWDGEFPLPHDSSVLSLPEKKEILLQSHGNYSLSSLSSLKPTTAAELLYFESLMADINCHTGSRFVMVDAQTYRQAHGHQKIAVCNSEPGFVGFYYGGTGVAAFNGDNPQSPLECVAVIDPAQMDRFEGHLEPEVLKNHRIQNWSHEFLHCLGLDHAEYPSTWIQKTSRSVMEQNGTPLFNECEASTSGRRTQDMITCYNRPPNPTGQDFCALQKLYGPSTNQSTTCQALRAETVKEYSYFTQQDPVPFEEFDISWF